MVVGTKTIPRMRPTWLIEFEIGAWIFGDNDDFLGQTRKQKPILSTEFHLVKRIRPGLWASLDVTWYSGGKQTVGGDPLRDKQNNLKLGGTLVVPFLDRHAIKVGYAEGVITRYGNAFDQLLVSYQMVFR